MKNHKTDWRLGFGMADKLHAQAKLEHVQGRYIGTGHADTTKEEWVMNNQRDLLSSLAGHSPLLEYMASAENVSCERTRYSLLDKMAQPYNKPA